MTTSPPARDTRRGLWLGVLAVVVFGLTLPMTRLAVGDASDPQLPPGFVTAARAAIAGLCSAAYLLAVRARPPRRALWPALAVCAAGSVVGFPLFSALALREVDAMHAAVVSGVLPLATAVVAAITLRQRASAAFWVCAVAGCVLVLGFAAWSGHGRVQPADALLLLAVFSAAASYVAGARVSLEIPPAQTVCWALLFMLPLTLPAALLQWPPTPVRAGAWAALGYVSLFSMWLGFFAWYRGLALGGVLRVSQVQLLQPFVALLAAVPLLGETLDAATVGFAAAAVGLVALGRRFSAAPAAAPRAPSPAWRPAEPEPDPEPGAMTR
ncbi:DMT family transporter [Rubrivivax gelatinosus]|uniref:Drug/metabolite transporter (DMT)-like permease n=1 Tax=Rubrivivax gelatinosus TaxID=28068 RepID=A0A4R2M3Z1_RUBGE|nr:DMT family transporter [Rubrivivax gelatinosus]MBK1690000.1 EamA family transporter [Rubrivivax gelatinosus]TCO98793.1 drug/metabolite transporter (DMT)-like permease [Rubrivivax gelatinosus]